MSRTLLCRRAVLACSLLLASTACDDANQAEAPEVAPAQAETPAAVVSQPTPAKPLEVVPPSPQQLPIPEDFEAEAEAAIDARTYKRDLAALSREIARDAAK